MLRNVVWNWGAHMTAMAVVIRPGLRIDNVGLPASQKAYIEQKSLGQTKVASVKSM